MYKINEVFETIQGEASFTGVPSIFLRLQGCPVGCSWCDTKQTWDLNTEYLVSLDKTVEKKADSELWTEATSEQIVTLFQDKEYLAKHVVITGGEPCMYDLVPLCELLHEAGFSTQIETSGTFEIKVPKETWVTVSPKINMRGGYKVLTSAMKRADEIKHPVAMQKHVDELEALFTETGVTPKLVYLQPISQKAKATKLAIDTCMKKNWRLSVQVHKYIGIN
ncbi:7-carboxy-7-deazaguanine synthase QueE [Pseudoalteromonas aurantia]|uniref:7-carboxy-7-deazaguanine synthase n=1 Tax=Pseudoalteromonas aurantia TaxID=43654 RepID=A0A5S3VBZ3_9GAMM|nr:7-carboxy-7-deazaguanine synthase QueE [Pseudoalteromonas aurantia]TMO69552.1 7-carboxy-7-deazaguanine synthase QueE [Pseudoalteromonas aurantia]TMO74348.1 7-carboxy-7-deazaguanine synthase QueE [Pseudoalteromonas aurantia]